MLYTSWSFWLLLPWGLKLLCCTACLLPVERALSCIDLSSLQECPYFV